MLITQHPLTHHQSRHGNPIKNVIIHWTVTNTFELAYRVLDQKGSSYHYMVREDQAWQLVDESETAYHAGVFPINETSIGISCIGTPQNPPTPGTLATLVELVTAICQRHDLAPEAILGHRDVRATQCPGTVDIAWVRTEVAQQLAATVHAVVPIPDIPADDQRARDIYNYEYDLIKGGFPDSHFFEYVITYAQTHNMSLIDSVNPAFREQYADELRYVNKKLIPVTDSLFRVE